MPVFRNRHRDFTNLVYVDPVSMMQLFAGGTREEAERKTAEWRSVYGGLDAYVARYLPDGNLIGCLRYGSGMWDYASVSRNQSVLGRLLNKQRLREPEEV